MKVKEGRKMRSNTFRHFFAVLLTIAALAAGHTNAWAQSTPGTFPVEVTFQGLMNGGKYAYVIQSSLEQTYNSGLRNLTNPDHVFIDEQVFDIGNNTVPLTMTVRGNFSFGATAGDATVDGMNADLTFNSSVKHIVGVQVSTYSGTPVSVESITGTTFSRKVFMLGNTTFGKVTLTMATHTPFDYAATIGGIEDTYLDDGINQPVPTVTYQEGSSPAITLTEGVDYTVSYNVGSTSGTVTVTGMGQYTGSQRKSYNIRQLQLSDFTQLSDGSYEIASTADLDRLAKYVSNGNNCSGVTFRQTADIAYNYTNAWDNIYHTSVDLENNFTPIGRYGKSFQGTYDGQNHTISGIRVDKFSAGSNHDNWSLGLFGYVLGGTVQNIVLRDSYIRGYQDLGGIVGYLSGGTVSGCTLHHVTVSTFTTDYTTYHADVVVGNLASGTVSTSHYRDCCLGRLLNNGKGQYNDPQNEVFALTLASGVTASKTSGESVTIDGETYYTEGSTFTLGYSGDVPTGYTHSGYSATGTTIDGSTLTMPNTDITVSATWTSAAERNLTATAASLFGESKYVTTFYHGTLDYQLPEGAKAYTASLDGEKVVFHLVGEDGCVIPHGTAVIIVADVASVTLSTLASTEVTAYAGNILIGSNSEVAVSGLSGIPYVLNISGGTLGLYKFTGESIPAGKAYYLKSE